MSVGGGKSNSQSQQTSLQDSVSTQGSESVDKSRSQSQSGSMGFSDSNQSVAFSDFFQKLYQGTAGAADKALTAGAPQLMQIASQLFTGGQEFMQGLKDNSGVQYMQDRLGDDKQVLQDQIGSLKTDIGDFFRDEINPAIGSRAALSGNLGGGRQGVAQGLAAQAAAKQFTAGATSLRAADQERRDTIAAQIAQNSLAAANTGLGALPSLLDISERGANAELGIYSNFASILGGPQTLTQSHAQDFSQAISQSAADAFSKSFGESVSHGESQGTSKSSSFNFNAGLW